MRIILKKSRVPFLGVQDLPENVVEHIVIGLQIYSLSISRKTLQIHKLVLRHSHILIISDLSCTAIMTIETKQASKGNKVYLVVATLYGLVNNISVTLAVCLMKVGGIELHNDLIVPVLVKLHQLRETHVAQVIHHLPNLLVFECG